MMGRTVMEDYVRQFRSFCILGITTLAVVIAAAGNILLGYQPILKDMLLPDSWWTVFVILTGPFWGYAVAGCLGFLALGYCNELPGKMERVCRAAAIISLVGSAVWFLRVSVVFAPVLWSMLFSG